jgi:hypothetical protein
MGKVIYMKGVTVLDIPADQVLEQAIGKMEGVVIMGYDGNGNEYFASTYGHSGTVIWLLERLKHLMLKNADEDYQ